MFTSHLDLDNKVLAVLSRADSSDDNLYETIAAERLKLYRYVTVRYCTLLHVTVCYCTLLYVTVRYCTLLHVTVRCCMLLYVTVRYCMLLYVAVCYCTLLYVTVCYCTLLYVTARYCMLLYVTVCYCTLVIEVLEKDAVGVFFPPKIKSLFFPPCFTVPFPVVPTPMVR